MNNSDEFKRTYRLVDTPLGKVAKTIVWTMFSFPAALTTLDLIGDNLNLKEWTQWLLAHATEVSRHFWSFIVPFDIEIPQTVSSALTLGLFLGVPILFRYLRARLTGTDVMDPSASLSDFEDRCYGWLTFLSAVTLLFIFGMVETVISGTLFSYLLGVPFVAVIVLFGTSILAGYIFIAPIHERREVEILYALAYATVVSLVILSVILLLMKSGYLDLSISWASKNGLLPSAKLLIAIPVAFVLLWLFNSNAALKIYTPMYIFFAMSGVLIVDKISAFIPSPPT